MGGSEEKDEGEDGVGEETDGEGICGDDLTIEEELFLVCFTEGTGRVRGGELLREDERGTKPAPNKTEKGSISSEEGIDERRFRCFSWEGLS